MFSLTSLNLSTSLKTISFNLSNSSYLGLSGSSMPNPDICSYPPNKSALLLIYLSTLVCIIEEVYSSLYLFNNFIDAAFLYNSSFCKSAPTTPANTSFFI